MIKLYTDGAVAKNVNRAGLGILIIKDKQQFQYNQITSTTDNHEAEFAAAIAGFELATKLIDKQPQILLYFSDSKIVIDSLHKSYARHFQAEVDKLLALQQQFQVVISTWIPDNQNHGAHNLAQQGLHSIQNDYDN